MSNPIMLKVNVLGQWGTHTVFTLVKETSDRNPAKSICTRKQARSLSYEPGIGLCEPVWVCYESGSELCKPRKEF